MKSIKLAVLLLYTWLMLAGCGPADEARIAEAEAQSVQAKTRQTEINAMSNAQEQSAAVAMAALDAQSEAMFAQADTLQAQADTLAVQAAAQQAHVTAQRSEAISQASIVVMVSLTLMLSLMFVGIIALLIPESRKHAVPVPQLQVRLLPDAHQRSRPAQSRIFCTRPWILYPAFECWNSRVSERMVNKHLFNK